MLEKKNDVKVHLSSQISESEEYLHVVFVGAGFSEDGRDGWVTANLQVIFGALILLKKIVKIAHWKQSKRKHNDSVVSKGMIRWCLSLRDVQV